MIDLKRFACRKNLSPERGGRVPGQIGFEVGKNIPEIPAPGAHLFPSHPCIVHAWNVFRAHSKEAARLRGAERLTAHPGEKTGS